MAMVEFWTEAKMGELRNEILEVVGLLFLPHTFALIRFASVFRGYILHLHCVFMPRIIAACPFPCVAACPFPCVAACPFPYVAACPFSCVAACPFPCVVACPFSCDGQLLGTVARDS
jgi:hypothetical protein